MSVATGIAIGVATGAAIQSNTANKQSEIALCRIIEKTYDASKATVSQMQNYADCIKTLYPQHSEMSSGNVIIWKIIIVCAFIGMAIGIYKAIKESCDIEETIVMSFCLGLFGAFLGGFVPVIIMLIILGFGFLFGLV